MKVIFKINNKPIESYNKHCHVVRLKLALKKFAQHQNIVKIARYASNIQGLVYKLRHVLCLGHYDIRRDKNNNIEIYDIIYILHIIRITNKYDIKLSCDPDDATLYSKINIDNLDYRLCILLSEYELRRWAFRCGLRTIDRMYYMTCVNIIDLIENTHVIKQYLTRPKIKDYLIWCKVHAYSGNSGISMLLRLANQLKDEETIIDLRKKSSVILIMEKLNLRVPTFMRKKINDNTEKFVRYITSVHIMKDYYYNFAIKVLNKFIQNESIVLSSATMLKNIIYCEFDYDILYLIMTIDKKLFMSITGIKCHTNIIKQMLIVRENKLYISKYTVPRIHYLAHLYNNFPYNVKSLNLDPESFEEFEKITGNISLTKHAIKKN